MKMSGFTLAEVLITLGIIGIVAAMTIPALINQSNQEELRAGLKKNVSVLSQAVMMNVAEGDNDFAGLTSGNGESSLYTMLCKRLLATNKVGSGLFYSLTLNDGVILTFTSNTGNCKTETSNCIITIDVNGKKGPNKLSSAVDPSETLSDKFTLKVYDQKVVPYRVADKYALYGITAPSASSCAAGWVYNSVTGECKEVIE